MNYRKPRGELTPTECKQLHHAWVEAALLGRPLNRLLTVKPGGDLSPPDHAARVAWTWNKLGGWSRYHGGGFYCLLVREKERTTFLRRRGEPRGDRVLGKRARISRTLLLPPMRLSTPVVLPIAASVQQSEAA
jgi:hypothetical protein